MSSRILAGVREHAALRPAALALQDGARGLTYRELDHAVRTVAQRLEAERVALWLDNGAPWAVADLALLQRGTTCVPVPEFFSPGQIGHLLRDVGADAVLTTDPARLEGLCAVQRVERIAVAGSELALCRIVPAADVPDLGGVAKVTYTSGTTGSPKGVRLRAAAMDAVAASLCQAIAATPADRTLATMPLAILLENIASLYAALLAGASAALVPMAEVGLQHAAGVDPARLLAALHRHRPTCMVLPPQLLRVLVDCAEGGAALPDSLRFIAVGGAPVGRRLLARAAALALPVFEGYGLSEATSVVTLNRPGATRPGSVGRPLPHARVAIDAGGEVHVGGALFDGYLHQPEPPPDAWATGDLGYLDDDGFLVLTGRRKHQFSTAFGRNVAPEWVEGELLAHPAVLQAVLFGEARPFNVALLVPRAETDRAAVERAVAEVNRGLPDYARVARFAMIDEPFSSANGLLTGTGRIRRRSIEQRYGALIQSLYSEEHDVGVL